MIFKPSWICREVVVVLVILPAAPVRRLLREQPGFRICEIGAIEEVEKLGPKLEVRYFAERGVLDEGQIQLRDPRNS